uniref:Amiloride-sensitive sodium channel n=1 Tax=Meloidogyne hapla TaxID=6305 RepID=A0A1I8BGS0_MELHA
MTMPNITFCMTKNNAWSHFNQTDISEEDTQKAIEEGLAKMPDAATFLDNNNMWDYKMVMNAYLKWMNEISKRNVSFDDFRQKVGWETLRRSQHRFDRLDVNKEEKKIKNDVKITWLSTKQLCFQPFFDKDSFIPIVDQEPFFVMNVVYNFGNVEDLDCMSVDVHGRPSDMARYMEGKGRASDGFYNELCIGDTYEAVMQIRAITTILPDPDDPIEQRCQIYGQKENSQNSELDCRRRCRLDLIRKICNCTAPSLSNFIFDPKELDVYPLCDYELCDIGNATESKEIEEWDVTCGDQCFPECTQTRYELDVTHKKALHPEELQLTLTWGAFEYLRLIQQERWSFTKFLSQIGGATGVWLGKLLLLTECQKFLTFLLTRAHQKVSKRKHTGVDSNYNNYGNNRRTSEHSGGTAHEMTNPSNNPLGGGLAKNPFGGKRK